MLSQGRWLRFNEDYGEQLNTYVDAIAVEPTEPGMEEISSGEPKFNGSKEVAALGYISADKDFSKIRTRSLVSSGFDNVDAGYVGPPSSARLPPTYLS